MKNENIIINTLLKLSFVLMFIILIAGLNIFLPWSRIWLSNSIHVRWREIISLLFITPTAIVTIFFIFFTLERDRNNFFRPLALLLIGCTWLAVSMGVHEPINAFESISTELSNLNTRVLWFWDEIFSHIVFFAGYMTVSFALLWSQSRNPLADKMSLRKYIIFLIYGILSGAGIIYALLPSKSYKVDLIIIASTIIIAEFIRKRKSFRKCPINLMMESGYLLAFTFLLLRLIILSNFPGK